MTMIGCCSCSCTKHYELKRDNEDWRTLSNVTFTSGKEGVNTLEPGEEIQFNIEIPCSNYSLMVDIESADNYQNIDHAAGVSGLSVRAGKCNQIWHNVTYATDADIDDWQSGVSGSAWTYSAGAAIYYSQPYSGGNFTFTLSEIDTETGAYGLAGGIEYDPVGISPNFVTDRPDLLVRREVNGPIEAFPAGLRTIPVTFRANSDTVVIKKVSVWSGPAHSLLPHQYVDSIHPYKEQFHFNKVPTTTVDDNGVNTSASLAYPNNANDDTLTISMTVDNTYLVDGTTDHEWFTKYDPLLPHRRKAANEYSQVLRGEEDVTLDETVADATVAQKAQLDDIRFDMANSLFTSDHSFEYEDPNLFFYLEPYADCTWSATYTSANSCTPINYINSNWDSTTSHTENRPVSLGPLDIGGSWGYAAVGVDCASGWSVNTDNFEDGFTDVWHDFGSYFRDQRHFQFTRRCSDDPWGKAPWLLPLTADYTEADAFLGPYYARRLVAESTPAFGVTVSSRYTSSSGNWETTTEWESFRIDNFLDHDLTTTQFTRSSSCSWIYDHTSPTQSWHDYGSPKATSIVVETGRGIPRLKENSLTVESATIDGTGYLNMFSYYDYSTDCSASPFNSYVQEKDVEMRGDQEACGVYFAPRVRYTNARNLLLMENGLDGTDDFWIGFPGPLWDFPDLDVILESSPGVYSVRTFDATELWALTSQEKRDDRKLKARTVTLPGITDTNDTMDITLRY